MISNRNKGKQKISNPIQSPKTPTYSNNAFNGGSTPAILYGNMAGNNSSSQATTETGPFPTENKATYADGTVGGIKPLGGAGIKVDATNNGTASTPAENTPATSEKPKDTYEAYLEKTRDESIAAAAESEQEAKRQAEVKYQRDVVNASTAYQKNISKYGANAEALAECGLMSSGYSDYHKAASYGQMRDEIQYAGATKYNAEQSAKYNREQAQRTAEATYSAKMAEKALSDEEKASLEETNKKNALLKLVGDVGNGSMSESVWRALASEYKLSDADIRMLEGIQNSTAENDKATDKESAISKLYEYALSGADSTILSIYGKYLKLSDEEMKDIITASSSVKQAGENEQAEQNDLSYYLNPPSSVADLTALKEHGKVSEEGYSKILSKVQSNKYNEIISQIYDFGFDINTDEILKLKEDGEISSAHYEKIVDAWNKAIPTGEDTFLDVNNSPISVNEACRISLDIINNPMCNYETGSDVIRLLFETYANSEIAEELLGKYGNVSFNNDKFAVLYFGGAEENWPHIKLRYDDVKSWTDAVQNPQEYFNKNIEYIK